MGKRKTAPDACSWTLVTNLEVFSVFPLKLFHKEMSCARNVAGKCYYSIFYDKNKGLDPEVFPRYCVCLQYGKVPIIELSKVSGTWEEV